MRAPHRLHDDQPEAVYAQAIAAMMDTIREQRIESVAIPTIGTAVLRFSPALAASVMARVMYAVELSTLILRWARICFVNAELQTVNSETFQRSSGEDIPGNMAVFPPADLGNRSL